MRKPLYQQLIDIFMWIVTAIQGVAGLISIYGDTSGWISIKTVTIFTFISFAIYLAMIVLFRYRRIKWVIDNQVIYIVKLGKKLIFSFLGGLIFLWSVAIINANKTNSPAVVASVKNVPVFDSNDKRFKVLILRWTQECKFQDKEYRIGMTIQNRLDELGRINNIPFATHYLADSISNFKPEMADSLLKFHHADLILYGSYSFKECEEGIFDKISFNYQINTTDWRISNETRHTEYKMEKFHGLEDIRKGNGKEGIGYIVNWIAGIAEVKQGEFAKAIKMFKQIKGYEENEKVLFQMAICYHLINDHNNAEICNQKVIRINPANIEAETHLGVSYAILGDMEKAKSSFENVLKYCPENVEALKNLADIYYAKKDTPTGKVYYGRITQVIKPDTHAHLVILGNAFNKIGQYTWAKDYLEKAVCMQPDNALYWRVLAEINKNLKDTAEALICYNRSIEIDPYDANTHAALAWLYYNKKDHAASQLHYTKAIQLNPSDAAAWTMLSLDYYASGDKEKAGECIEKVLATHPDNKIALSFACRIYKEMKRFDKWKQYIEATLKVDSTNVTLWNDLGLANNELNDYKNALSCFTRTLKMFPENAYTYYNLAATYSHMRDKRYTLNYLAKSVSCDEKIKSFPAHDKTFAWLDGNIELCNITYNDNLTNKDVVFNLRN